MEEKEMRKEKKKKEDTKEEEETKQENRWEMRYISQRLGGTDNQHEQNTDF